MISTPHRRTRREHLYVLLTAAFVLAGCGGKPAAQDPTPVTAPTTTTSTTLPTGDPPSLALRPLAQFTQPVAMVQRDGSEDFYVAEKPGRVMLMRNGAKQDTPILDLTSSVSSDGERGLLGLVFAPNSRALYVDYTDKNGAIRIVEYQLGTDGNTDIGTQRELLKIDKPYANHNGGSLAFGPDAKLYISVGDGGGSGDPQRNAQNLTTLLGKVLRIDPSPSGTLPYTVPYDNPFVRITGARGEIWAYGLRNPADLTFGRRDASAWIRYGGDGTWDEIDRTAKDPKGGQNYGWPLREGTHAFGGQAPEGSVEPVYEASQTNPACNLVGGFAYGGRVIPDLIGRYVFGDTCTGQVSTLTLRGTAWEPNRTNVVVANLRAFAQDHNGELYTLSLDGQITKMDAE